MLIGAAATILGNITVGRGAQIAAGSLVLKAVAPRVMVAGAPAQPVGQVQGAQSFLHDVARSRACARLLRLHTVTTWQLPGRACVHADIVFSRVWACFASQSTN